MALARGSPAVSEADIKGRIAEALVAQMFRAMGWRVLPFGMEHTHPHLFESVAGRLDPVSQAIRRQPDFVVQRDGGQPFFVEVKYRANGSLAIEDIGGHDYPYKTSFIVLVTPYRIQCVTASDLFNGVKLSRFESDHYFADREEFMANRGVVMQFIEMGKKFFQFDAR